MEFQIAEAIELIKTLAETENLTQSQALSVFVAEAELDVEYASQLKAALYEEYTLQEMASDSLTNALKSVFIEGVEDLQEVDTKETQEGTKYKVRVKDRASGSSYVRYATRAKIAELRANPNISSVELTDHGSTGEDDRGERTAAAKGGGKDHDGDGKVESSSKEHAGVVHNAIQRKKGGTPDGQDTRKEEVEISEGGRPTLGQIWADRRNKAHREAGYANDQVKWEKSDKKKKKEVKEGMHRDAETGEVVDKAEVGKTYYPAQPRKKSSVALRKEKEAAEKKVEEGIDFKGAAREQERRDRIQAEKDKKNPSGKDRRLMLRKFRPGASAEERAEGGRDSMREKGTSPKKDGKKMFEAYLELREAKAKTREEARKKLDAHRAAMKDGGESPYFGKIKDGKMDKGSDKDPWSTHSSDAKAHSKEDRLKEGWKPDPTEKRQKKASKLARDEAIESGKRDRDRDDAKVDRLYKRRQAVQSKTKMRNEDFVMEADLVDAGRENQTQRSKKKLTGENVDNSTNVKLMPRINEALATEGGITKAENRLAKGSVNEAVRSRIKELRSDMKEECCPKCGTPECTCDSKEEKPKKKKVKIDESGMPILETKQESRNNARPGPSEEMKDPEGDPLGEPGHMNPKGKPKRYKNKGEAPGDRRPNDPSGPELPFEKGTVPNGSGV